MIETGSEAPDFTLPNQDGEDVKLSDLRGRRVVLYFYPKADTPGCTTQACGIRDRGGEYEDAGATVLGVSPDPVRGGYRDRLLVELAQNAADAAVRAGTPGRLRLELTGDTLLAANTGAPLDAAGVQGLATLRASGKRDETGSVGRFGVGF